MMFLGGVISVPLSLPLSRSLWYNLFLGPNKEVKSLPEFYITLCHHMNPQFTLNILSFSS